MSMKNLFLEIISVAYFLSLSGFCFSDIKPGHECEKENCSYEVESVSIVELLSNSSKYNGKKIRVKGYMSLEHEGSAIYFSKEHYDYSLSENSVSLIDDDWVVSQRMCHESYCFVEGVFNAKAPAHFGRTMGQIEDIYRVERILNRGEIQKLREDE